MLNINNINLFLKFIYMIIIIIVTFGIIALVLQVIRRPKLERRFSKFTVNVINQKELSLFDKFRILYLK